MNSELAFAKTKAAYQRWRDGGCISEAVAELKEISTFAEDESQRLHALWNLGTILTESSRWDDAQVAFREALELPQSGFSRFYLMLELAELSFDSGDREGGLNWINNSLDVPCQDPSVYVGSAYKILCKQLGTTQLASDVLDRLKTALRLNWQFLLPECSIPENIVSIISALDANERSRKS